MSANNKKIETSIGHAIEKLQQQENPNLSAIAREFNVPYTRLRARWKGRKSLFARPSHSQRFDSAQEKALCSWIEYNDGLGLSLKRPQILRAATSILRLSDASAPPLGEKWLKRWLERHPQYRIRRRKSLDIERKRAHDVNLIREWFTRLRAAIDSHGIQPSDIYNFDETGFQIGVGRDQWIITREPRRKIVAGVHTNREYVTVVEAISTDGFIIPPLIILSAQQIQYRWFHDLNQDERIAVTDTGYTNDQLTYQWIQHFEKATRARMRGTWRMLICDGFGSHLTFEMVKFCEENDILLFFLPPHTSHLLQPLDVGVFNVYKHYHSEAIESATLTGCSKFTKQDFLAAINSIRAKTFTLSTIQLGFRLSGIWPTNPEIVCEKLVEYDHARLPSAPSTPSSHSTNSTSFSTPKTIEKIRIVEERFFRMSHDIEASQNLMQKLSKGAQACLYELEELRQEKEMTQAATAARHARYGMSRASIRSKGIISSSHVKRMKKNEERLTELEAIDKLRPKWKKVMMELKRHCRRQGRRV